MANGFEITKETWEHMPKEQRDWILFETILSMKRAQGSMKADIDKLKKRPLVDRACSFAGGVVGGIAAFFGVKLF